MELTLYQSQGTLRYIDNKLIVEVDQGISDFYRALIPKWIRTNKQLYPAHISVVRKEIPPNMKVWGKYEGNEIPFSYSNVIHNGEIYFWLNAWSNQLEQIRLELGLPVDSLYTRPPDGLNKTFHITIGNLKNKNAL